MEKLGQSSKISCSKKRVENLEVGKAHFSKEGANTPKKIFKTWD